ncbi:hypothetical protein MRX96_015187 [Rhipicephalus microplus]
MEMRMVTQQVYETGVELDTTQAVVVAHQVEEGQASADVPQLDGLVPRARCQEESSGLGPACATASQPPVSVSAAVASQVRVGALGCPRDALHHVVVLPKFQRALLGAHHSHTNRLVIRTAGQERPSELTLTMRTHSRWPVSNLVITDLDRGVF